MSRDFIGWAILASVLSVIPAAGQGAGEQSRQPNSPRPDFRQLLQKMSDFSPDPCGPPYGEEQNWHSGNVESRLFGEASEIVIRALNESGTDAGLPNDRATEALKKLEKMSAEINAAWPEGNRFHFTVLNLPPALVVKMGIRAHETFAVFGIRKEDSGKRNRTWQEVGLDEQSGEGEAPQRWLELYPLHRGPSGNPRFLARIGGGGCAGSTGVQYDAREWNPRENGYVDQVIKQDGSFGLDDKVPGFEQIGKLQTEGSLITLPYCWFSAIDTWDNPSLCAVDTYDLSGDEVRFRSRFYNRPDLVPIAKAIEYAEKRDYPAVLGYCGSPEVAGRMVADFPPYLFADDLRVTSTGSGKERVEMGYDPTYRLDVEKRGDHWLVMAFSRE